ncbi:hypothetical protein PoB_007167800 [Plakobranchus ocellatus]|uniref:Uncharacterized protein n=1 Tax=Plakobranchus ocellatus TaxID=259542 RepID=A0AAV4DM88_9GAST|nr:hypothetical protein PoB_007167800 [Plakobranchus ocellatus]
MEEPVSQDDNSSRNTSDRSEETGSAISVSAKSGSAISVSAITLSAISGSAISVSAATGAAEIGSTPALMSAGLFHHGYEHATRVRDTLSGQKARDQHIMTRL